MYFVNCQIGSKVNQVRLSSLREVKAFIVQRCVEHTGTWVAMDSAGCCVAYLGLHGEVRYGLKYRKALTKASSKLAKPTPFERVQFKSELAQRRQAEVLLETLC